MSKQKGSHLKDSISSITSGLSSQISQIDNQISSTEKVISRQNKIREDVLVKLAEFWLQDGGKLAAQFHDINGRVQRIFDEKSERRKEVNEQLERLVAQEVTIQAKIAESEQEVASYERTVGALQNAINRELGESPEFIAIDKEVDTLIAIIAKDSERLRSLEDECAMKRGTFESDPLFVYLNERSYGTDAYAPSWFKRPDAWLARVTSYADNVKRYDILGEITPRVRAANQERSGVLAIKTKLRTAWVTKVESKHGLKAAEMQLEVAKTTKSTRVTQLQSNQSAQSTLRTEKANIDGHKDPFQQRAKSELKTFFGSESVEQLRERAHKTECASDDRLVSDLEQAELEVNSQRKKAKQLIAERGALEAQLTKAKAFASRFSREDYDSRNARFDSSVDINSLLLGYMAGSITESRAFQTLDSGHSVYREPTRSYSSYSSSSSGSSYSSSSSSWDSGSSFSSGGGFGGGDSSSGGGF
jgi:uncharacterized membrane protein YgcG